MRDWQWNVIARAVLGEARTELLIFILGIDCDRFHLLFWRGLLEEIDYIFIVESKLNYVISNTFNQFISSVEFLQVVLREVLKRSWQ